MKRRRPRQSSRRATARRAAARTKPRATEPANTTVAPPPPPPPSPASAPAPVAIAQPAAGAREFPPGWNRLTPTQKRVFQLIAAGRTTNAIAAELGASPHTVQAHRVHLSVRLGLRGRRALQQVAHAHHGLV